MYSEQTRSNFGMTNSKPGGTYRITLRGHNETRVMVLAAEDRLDATLRAERSLPSYHMVIAEKVEL